MARPNFKYEKRQKELAKQKKAEDKRQRRLERRNAKPENEAIDTGGDQLPADAIADETSLGDTAES